MRNLPRLLCLLLVLALSSCAQKNSAPGQADAQPGAQGAYVLPEMDLPEARPADVPMHTVKVATTAAKMAKLNKLSVAEFCWWNDVAATDVLPAGRKVYLQVPPTFSRSVGSASATAELREPEPVEPKGLTLPEQPGLASAGASGVHNALPAASYVTPASFEPQKAISQPFVPYEPVAPVMPHDAPSQFTDDAIRLLKASADAPQARKEKKSGDPAELAGLLDMKSTSDSGKSAVMQMRPSAIREAAQLVTMQTAIAWRYGQILNEVERHAAIMDTAFNFGPLLMTQGDAQIMPPVLTKAGASMRIEEADTATAAATSYELLEPAKYVSVVPNWRWYLMADDFPKAEKPNPAVMPKNSEERAIWKDAVRETWALGIEQANQLFVDNMSRLVRDYRGIMLYHLLSAQNLLSRVNLASSDLGIQVSGNKMNVGQKVYRISSPSRFTVPQDSPEARPIKNAPKKRARGK